MKENTSLIVGLLAVVLLVSAMGTLTAVTKWSITGLQTGTTNATVLQTADITLFVNSVDLGSLGIGDNADTSDGSPPPFVVQNDGSVNINVSVNSTELWTAIPATTSSNYRVKCRGAEPGYTRGVACGAGSVESYTDMPVNEAATKIIGTLPFIDTGDRNRVDIYALVPIKESVGPKTATVTFIATQT